MTAGEEGTAPWRRRFSAAQAAFPDWASAAPHRLVVASPRSGRWQVHGVDLGTGGTCQLTDSVTGVSHAQISPDGRSVWWFDDQLGNEVGTWRISPFEGGQPEPVPLPPAHPTGLVLGHRIAVTSGFHGDHVRVTRLLPGGASHVIYRHPALARVASLSADGALLCIEHGEHGDSQNPALRITGLSGHAVAGMWDGPGLGLWAGRWSPVHGDARLLVHHERDGIRRPAIWGPAEDFWLPIDCRLPGEVDAEWYPAARNLLLRHHWQGRTHLYRWDVRTAALDRLDVPDGTVHAARVRPDGSVWSLHSSGQVPPSLLSDGRQLCAPARSRPDGVPYSDFRAGGVHCFLAVPRAPRPYPTILILHGGPARHDTDGFSPRVQAWVDHGFAVALVNYRGSSGYGRAWRDALRGDLGPGLSELEDLAAVRQYLAGHGVADGRIILQGGSWGGYLALLAIGCQPGLWSLAIAVAPVTDWAAAYQDEIEPTRAHDRALFGGTPQELPGYYAQRSPITFAGQVRVPVLILAGRSDPHCPPRQIVSYVRRLRNCGKTCELYEFSGGHGSLDISEQIRQQELQLEFASRHLGTPGPA